jgi:hypothetical protein
MRKSRWTELSAILRNAERMPERAARDYLKTALLAFHNDIARTTLSTILHRNAEAPAEAGQRQSGPVTVPSSGSDASGIQTSDADLSAKTLKKSVPI